MNVAQVESTYAHFLALTGEPNAAALLTQCVYLPGQQAAVPDAPLTVGDAAQQLGVSQRTVYDLCESGRLQHHRVGVGRGTIRVMPADVAAYRKAARG